MMKPWVMTVVVVLVVLSAVLIGFGLFAIVLASPLTWFLFGAVWFGKGFRHYRTQLTVRDTPVSKINAAAIGLIEVSGRVQTSAPATAPMSGKPCVYWRAKVEMRQDNKTSIMSEDHSKASSFEIDDGTGRILIWATGSDLIVADSLKWEGSAAELEKKLPPGPLRAAVTRLPDRARGHFIVTEQSIEVGETLYVMGTLSERRDVQKPKTFADSLRWRNARASAAQDTRIEPGVFDVIKVLLSIWGVPVERFVSMPGRASPSETPPDVDPHQVLIWRGDRDRPFIIADSAEGIVIGTLTQWTMLALLGGSAVMVGTLILYWGGFFS